jgi:hypothetical protein
MNGIDGWSWFLGFGLAVLGLCMLAASEALGPAVLDLWSPRSLQMARSIGGSAFVGLIVITAIRMAAHA